MLIANRSLFTAMKLQYKQRINVATHCWILDPLLLNSLVLKSPLQPTRNMMLRNPNAQWSRRPRTCKV